MQNLMEMIYIGDGDTSSYKDVITNANAKPYGDDIYWGW